MQIVSAREAVSRIKPGSRVLAILGNSEFTELIRALLADRDRIGSVDLVGGMSLGDYEFLNDEYDGFINYITWQINPKILPRLKAKGVRFIPLPRSCCQP